jgi:hypothetical protein
MNKTGSKLAVIGIIMLALAIIVFLFISGLVWLFCYAFGYTFMWKYALGIWAAIIMLRMVFGGRSK